MSYIRLLGILCCVALTVAKDENQPTIRSLHIESRIAYRFSTTTVRSLLANPDMSEAKEAVLKVQLPKSAFITAFSMFIDGKTIHGEVKEKEQAAKEYTQAKSEGKTAGHVNVNARDASKFQVAVNVAAGQKVNFTLVYQELLLRKLGLYTNTIHINPGQVVKDFRIDVFIDESRNISALRVPPLKTNAIDSFNSLLDNPLARIEQTSPKSVHITYRPTPEQQKQVTPLGLNGQFTVMYDVMRDLDAGDIQVIDGYFVHYFAPQGLPPVNKNVFFILDVSGSMGGTKIEQLKAAMLTILGDLRENDLFNIMKFSDRRQVWNDESLVRATGDNIQSAKSYVRSMRAGGGTAINSAIIESIQFIDSYRASRDINLATIVFFLTDGQPSSGVTNTKTIIKNVKEANKYEYSLFSLAFGNGADFSFLQKLSLQNNGFARKIYEDSDTALQLQGFYDEISTPLLSNVQINYLNDIVDPTSLTKTKFYSYFNGSELVIAGKLKDAAVTTNALSTEVTGTSQDGALVLEEQVPIPDETPVVKGHELRQFTERLWAYLTIKALNDKMIETESAEEKEAFKQKALELALKYQFVTKLTSMIVISPEDPTEDAASPDDGDSELYPKSNGGRQHFSSSKSRRPSFSRPTHGGGGGGGSADSDPHFIIGMRGIDKRICFDVNGSPGDIIQLLHDEDARVTVNAKIIEGDRTEKSRNIKTYFGKISILTKKVKLVITTKKIFISGQMVRWTPHPLDIQAENILIKMQRNNITVVLDKTLSFTVARHMVKHKHPGKVDFLGFYVDNSEGLSRRVHGLIGQFEYQEASITVRDYVNPTDKVRAVLSFHAPRLHKHPIDVYLGNRRNLLTRKHVPCWHVRNNGRGLIDGHWQDYRVPKLTYNKLPDDLVKKLPTVTEEKSTNRRILLKHFQSSST